MSFLTPLYIAAVAAVALPVLFHMIRTRPRGKVPFSTLMFLDPSPPRITRRSRLDNWPLLLLRALALALLAVAFARPFWRTAAATEVEADAGRHVAILLDTSASMRREGLWKDAVASAQRIVDEASPADHIGLFTFDRQLKPLVDFAEWSALEPAARGKLVRQRLAETEPGWAATHLGEALVSTAEMLVASNDVRRGSPDPAGRDVRRGSPDPAGRATAGLPRGEETVGRGVWLGQETGHNSRETGHNAEITLISDLQIGSRTAPLGSVSWPADVRLSIEQLTPAEPTNAGLQRADGEGAPADDDTLRVRVVNAGDSTSEQFQLAWKADGPFFSDSRPVDVYVPAGSSRIVRVPFAADLPTPVRLVLTGDRHDFDNSIDVNRPVTQDLNVLFVGSDAADDPAGLRHYIEFAFPQNRIRRVSVVGQPSDGPAIAADVRDVALVIVAEPLPDDTLASLRRHAEAGGSLLFVATSNVVQPSRLQAGQTPAPQTGVCRSFGRLIGQPQLHVEEAEVAGYAMLGSIDFTHPLFASFDDPRFSDFTSIHFWKHRRVDEHDLAGCRILARFDDGDPAVVTAQIGKGTATLLTSGWHPADSQLARSTKFVPLMNALLELSAGRTDRRQEFTAGLAAEESQTGPLPLETLEALGIPLKPTETPVSRAATALRERQLQAAELEGQQKMWRWLIVAAIAALVAETSLAARCSRSQTSEIRGQNSDDRDQKSAITDQLPEVRSHAKAA